MSSLVNNLFKFTFRTFSFLFLTGLAISANGQSNSYSWNNLVSWNGVTHWTKYMIISPDYFGPNALPIPELKTGLIETKPYFEFNLNGHFSDGDNTQNAYFRYIHPFNNKISVEMSFVPLEHYSIDEKTRDKRKIRNADPMGFAIGDIQFGTVIQLVKDHDILPDITYAMYFRTASGGKLDDARYTDMPGYNFDITFGKNILRRTKYTHTLRWYASLGFYAWQTNLDDYLQNDAISGGIGFLYKKNNFEIENILNGYYGYISNKNQAVVVVSDNPYIYDGDQPLIYKITLSKTFPKYKFNIALQHGLNDFSYTSLLIGFKYFPSYPE